MWTIGDASRFDERSHLAPRRHTTPGPETLIEPGPTFLLDLTDTVDHILGPPARVLRVMVDNYNKYHNSWYIAQSRTRWAFEVKI
jgi:hypothetical protein